MSTIDPVGKVTLAQAAERAAQSEPAKPTEQSRRETASRAEPSISPAETRQRTVSNQAIAKLQQLQETRAKDDAAKPKSTTPERIT